ncbi:MAG: PIN domain-containing protein [Anaerolineae bacterium]
MTALLDTGVLLAAIAENDNQHEISAIALEEEDDLLLPDVVVPELAYLLLRDVGYSVLVSFLKAVAGGELRLVPLTTDDLDRAAAILEQYADARVDFVDCVIVAMAERLDIVRILTLDRRHFGLFRPRHCAAFVLLP